MHVAAIRSKPTGSRFLAEPYRRHSASRWGASCRVSVGPAGEPGLCADGWEPSMFIHRCAHVNEAGWEPGGDGLLLQAPGMEARVGQT